jgi:peroxiredoxin
MPAMEQVYREYAEKGFTILAVNTTYQDNPADVIAFVQEHNLTFPILLDRDRIVSEQYQLLALPSSFFIDRDGIIQEVIFGGPMAEALLRIRVEKLLEEVP